MSETVSNIDYNDKRYITTKDGTVYKKQNALVTSCSIVGGAAAGLAASLPFSRGQIKISNAFNKYAQHKNKFYLLVSNYFIIVSIILIF